MKLASFSIKGAPTWGVIDGDEAIDVGSVLHGKYADLKAVVAANAVNEIKDAVADAPRHPVTAITWLPVIGNPDKILCVGLNYDEHRKETGRPTSEHPTIFVRFANSQTGHLANMPRPPFSTQFDYEGELAVVIGKPGRYIKRADAFDHVAGYACYNDATIRDWQRHTSQFTPGKNFPETGPFGPWMVTPDELGGKLAHRRIQTRVNDLVVQDATLGDMIFDIPTIIEYCSGFTRLESGDVIATGTPGGVGFRREPQLFIKPGDTVHVEIDGVGHLMNGVVDEKAT
jgi:2-keto-4-pentenoate hydratase/2-oxohepta-3-ene-1,7-dioic acid hydratase in catechol pathway